MKKIIVMLMCCIFLTMGIAIAAQDPHSGHSASGSTSPAASAPDPQAGHVTPGSAQSGASAHDMGKHMQMMQEHKAKMNSLMEKIRATTDPRDRAKLMGEHRESMKEAVKMMKSMPGCTMMSGGGMHGGSGGTHGGMQGGGMMGMESMMMCHGMMEGKLDLMQGMIEGLLESSQAEK